MKKLSHYLMLIALVCIVQPGCTKNAQLKNSDDPGPSPSVVKDTLLTGRNWYGGFIKDERSKEYFALHFNADSTLLWNELSGEYAGTWSMKDKHIRISVPAKDLEVTGDLTDKNGLTNISGNNSGLQVILCQLVNHRAVNVENTNWSGNITQIDNGQITPIELDFLNDGQLQFIANGINLGTFDNTGSDSTAVFRFNLQGTIMFGIFVSDTHIDGMQVNENFLVGADKR